MTPSEGSIKIENLKIYYNGLRDGVLMFAHWKDGMQYVGTTGKSYREAIIALNKEEEKRIAEIQGKIE